MQVFVLTAGVQKTTLHYTIPLLLFTKTHRACKSHLFPFYFYYYNWNRGKKEQAECSIQNFRRNQQFPLALILLKIPIFKLYSVNCTVSVYTKHRPMCIRSNVFIILIFPLMPRVQCTMYNTLSTFNMFLSIPERQISKFY